MKKFSEFYIKECLDEQIDKGVPFTQPLMRPGSDIWSDYICAARKMYSEGLYETDNIYENILLESNIGEEAEYKGEKVKLDHPRYGGSKKFIVYTKDKDGKVVKVQFGSKELSVKLSDPKAVKSFVARHRCATKKDKTTAGWWSCNLPAFADILGIDNPNNERYW